MLDKPKKIKPKIEDKIPKQLDGDMQKIALDFVVWLRQNKMTLSSAGFRDAWKANCKGKMICYVKLRNNEREKTSKWVVYPNLAHFGEYEHILVEEGLQNIIWENVCNCFVCRPECSMKNSRDKIILGKVCEKLCGSRHPLWFFDPNEETIDCIKRLLELEKQARDEMIVGTK